MVRLVGVTPYSVHHDWLTDPTALMVPFAAQSCDRRRSHAAPDSTTLRVASHSAIEAGPKPSGCSAAGHVVGGTIGSAWAHL